MALLWSQFHLPTPFLSASPPLSGHAVLLDSLCEVMCPLLCLEVAEHFYCSNLVPPGLGMSLPGEAGCRRISSLLSDPL